MIATIIIKFVLLWILIFVFTIEGYNISEKISSKYLVRNKRDNSPTILKIKFRHQNKIKVIPLNRVEDRTLASMLIPIRTIESDGEITKKYKLGYIEPIFYHGKNSYSAITYFPHTNTLHGVIDGEFYIENLPLNDAFNPNIVDTFLHSITDMSLKTLKWHEIGNRNKRGNEKRKLDEESSSSSSSKKMANNDDKYNYVSDDSKSYVKKNLYAEILLMVDVSLRIDENTNVITKKYEKNLMYVLSYWNAVDMLFKYLKFTDIKLNIAGIIMAKSDIMASDMIVDPANYIIHDDNLIYVKQSKALNDFGSFLYSINFIERDSYDFSIWMTRGILFDDSGTHNRRDDLGVSAEPTDCGGSHNTEDRNKMISNRAVVTHDDKYANYQTAARELAHLMFVVDDDTAHQLHDSDLSNCLSNYPLYKSKGIMDPSADRKAEYLMWSYCSELQFQNYANSRSSCCLLNYPYRTKGYLDPPKILTVETQCQCYKSQPLNNVNENICDKSLYCKSKNGNIKNIGMPLDGTPCQNDDFNGICHENECIIYDN